MHRFFVKNKKSINQRTDVGRRLTSIDDNNCNENRNKTRRDHDDTKKFYSNNQLLPKLIGWSRRGDGIIIGNEKIMFEL